MKNFNDDYYTGFDIGTDSVGYAVADTDYNLCKFKGNAIQFSNPYFWHAN